MATIFRRKRSRSWYISYRYDGKRITKSLKTTDRTIAVSEKRKLEGKLEEKTHEEYGKQNIADLVNLYKDSLRKSGRKERTNEIEFYILDKFIRSLDKNKRTIDAITDTDTLRHLEKYENGSAVTYKNVLGVIKRFFRFAIRKKKLSPAKDPTFDISPKRIRRVRPTFFSDEEYLHLEKVAEGHPLFPMIAVARYCGLRLAELLYLEWEDFDFSRRELHVRNKPQWGHTIKNYEERVVPLCEELIFKLLPYRKESGLCFPVSWGKSKGKPYNLQGPRTAMNRILKQVGLKETGERWHKLRRTYASRLVQEGVDILKVSRWLGHSSVAVTEAHYAYFRPRYDRDIEKLNIQAGKPRQTADTFADTCVLPGKSLL